MEKDGLRLYQTQNCNCCNSYM